MKRIHFNEVVTRDGFQIEPQFVPTEAKVAKFVETVRGDNRPYAPVPPRQMCATPSPVPGPTIEIVPSAGSGASGPAR